MGVTVRRELAILLVVSLLRPSIGIAQPNPGEPSAPVDAGVSAPPGTSSIAPESSAAPQNSARVLVPSTAEARETTHPNPLLEVPVVTWICGGLAAALFGVALGFGVSAANIDHRAGINLSPSGVDLGLTRRTALAGQTDATIANGLFIGAGVAAVVGLAFAAFSPEPAVRWSPPSTGHSP